MLFTIDHIEHAFASHRHNNEQPNEGRRAAVLIPIVQHSGTLNLLLTKRAETVEHHKGQISFPGGVIDDHDQDAIHAALRESEEEIGLHRSGVKIIGTLDTIIIPTGFIVTPIVGYIDQLPVLQKNDAEVAEIILIPLDDFVDENNFTREFRVLKGKEREIFVFDVWKEPIWGATAHIIRMFTDIIRGTV